jgi:cytochrome P450
MRRVARQVVFKLPFAKLQRINDYFTSFEEHVLEMVDERRALGAEGIEKGDLFSNLIRASDAEEGTARLNKIELLSNIHIFLLAGHETTSNTLMATLMLLAMYPEDQERIAAEARAAFADSDGLPGYDAFSELVSTHRLELNQLCTLG